MPKHGKKYDEAVKKIDLTREYPASEAIALLKEVAFAGFE